MRPRRKTSQRAARRSFASGGSSTAPSPTAWRKPAIDCSALRSCRRANGEAHERRMRSNDCMRSSSAGSKRRPCCPQQRLPPCCSGPCSPPVRSTCARSMAGRRSPQGPSISQLTSPPNPIASCRWRLRHIEFQHKARRHLVVEDEALILVLEESVLNDAGYETLAASSLSEALAIIEDPKQKFD